MGLAFGSSASWSRPGPQDACLQLGRGRWPAEFGQ